METQLRQETRLDRFISNQEELTITKKIELEEVIDSLWNKGVSPQKAQKPSSTSNKFYGAISITYKGIEPVLSSISDKTKVSFLLEFEKEFRNCPVLKDAWAKAREAFLLRRDLFEKNSNVSSRVMQEVCHIALITYVIESPFYSNFNRLTREFLITDHESFPYKAYFNLLTLALVYFEGHSIVTIPQDKVLPLYRGATGQFQFSMGDEVSFQHFTSTTTDMNIAKQFAGPCGTVFKFTGVLEFNEQHRGMYTVFLHHIPSLVGLPQEQECLLSPFLLFKVIDINSRDGVQYIDLVLHADLRKFDESGNFNGLQLLPDAKQ